MHWAQSYSLTACSNLAFLDSINFLTAAGDNEDVAPYALGGLNEMQDCMEKWLKRFLPWNSLRFAISKL